LLLIGLYRDPGGLAVKIVLTKHIFLLNDATK